MGYRSPDNLPIFLFQHDLYLAETPFGHTWTLGLGIGGRLETGQPLGALGVTSWGELFDVADVSWNRLFRTSSVWKRVYYAIPLDPLAIICVDRRHLLTFDEPLANLGPVLRSTRKCSYERGICW